MTTLHSMAYHALHTIHRNWGSTYLQRGQHDHAVRACTRALAFGPADAATYALRARAYHADGDFARALADHDAALALDRAHAPAYVNRGLTRAALGDVPGALADYNMALALDPRSVPARINRAAACAQQGNWQGALADLSAALRHAPDVPYLVANRAEALLMLGQHARAAADFARAAALMPALRRAHAGLALAHYAQGHTRVAAHVWQHLVTADPHYNDADWVLRQHAWDVCLRPSLLALVQVCAAS